MNAIAKSVSDRVEDCLAKQSRLTLGEVELLNGLRDKGEVPTLLEEKELQLIEQKLGVAG